jgi:hypothetical protein
VAGVDRSISGVDFWGGERYSAWGGDKVPVLNLLLNLRAKGTWISEGTAARKVGELTGEIRVGGGYQGLINVDDLPSSSVLRTDIVPWVRP